MGNRITKWEQPKSYINFHGNTKPHIQNTDPSLMTPSEVAKFFRVSVLTIKRWEKLGRLNPIRINSRGDRRYLRSEITRLLEGKDYYLVGWTKGKDTWLKIKFEE